MFRTKSASFVWMKGQTADKTGILKDVSIFVGVSFRPLRCWSTATSTLTWRRCPGETQAQCPLLARLRIGTVLQVYQRFPCSSVKKRQLWELRENATALNWGCPLTRSFPDIFPSSLTHTHSTGSVCCLYREVMLTQTLFTLKQSHQRQDSSL